MKFPHSKPGERTAEYRHCAHCNDYYASITSDADDRYTFCCHECEEYGKDNL